MSQSVGDLGLQYHFTGNRESGGIYGLIDTYSNSTDEEKKLLSNECKIRLECCRCGNFFLSHSELLKHKQNYCRPLYSTIASSHSVVAVPAFAEKTHTELRNADHGKKERTSPSQQDRGEIRISGTKTDSQSPKRAKIILKRTDVVNVVNKHRKHCTLSQSNLEHEVDAPTCSSHSMVATMSGEGQEIMESIPYALVTVDTMPPDRFPVLIPQDNSGCYREMNLRNRGSDSSKNGIARKVGSEELKILERMDKYQTVMVDLSLLTCSHSDCKEKQPFSSLFTFAYHLTVKHNRRSASNKRIPCYLCDFESQTYTALIEHLKNVHEQYYQEHVTARSTFEELKRGRKGKQAKTVEIRGRSLSPLSDDFLETEESSDGSEEIGYDSAPVLEPIANMETENIELTVKDRMDYIIAVVCSDVKKAQVNNKYELNIQLNPEKLDPSVSKKKKSPSIWLRTARKRMVENVTMGQLAGPSKTSQESDKAKHENEPSKKRGRGLQKKSKAEQAPKNDIEKEDLVGNSDEAESYKCRPSRQRRKPNWIDENYVIGFKNKRARRDDDDIDLECAQPKRQSRPSSRSGKSRSSRTESKYARSADSQRLTPVEPCSTILGIQSEASSEETSNSSTPAPNESIYNVATSSHELDNSAARSSLSLSSTGPSSTCAENARDVVTKKTRRLQCNPRARRMKYEDNLLSDVGEEIACTSSKGAKGQKTSNNAKAASSDRRPASHSRRKQDLSTIRENSDEIMIVRYSSDEASLSNDLSEIPVCFTEKQRDLFLSLIRPASSLNDDASNAHTRMQCGDIIANISERKASTKCISRAP